METARLAGACEGKSYSQMGLNVVHLRQLCEQRGLPTMGSRAKLLSRLCRSKSRTKPTYKITFKVELLSSAIDKPHTIIKVDEHATTYLRNKVLQWFRDRLKIHKDAIVTYTNNTWLVTTSDMDIDLDPDDDCNYPLTYKRNDYCVVGHAIRTQSIKNR